MGRSRLAARSGKRPRLSIPIRRQRSPSRGCRRSVQKSEDSLTSAFKKAMALYEKEIKAQLNKPLFLEDHLKGDLLVRAPSTGLSCVAVKELGDLEVECCQACHSPGFQRE